jgi:hypothetical protein
MIIIDLTGQRFGRLSVLGQNGTLPNGPKTSLKAWACVCDCGVRVTINGHALRTGNTRSCGCYKKEVTQTIKTTHGKSGTPLYRIWADIKKRCHGKGSEQGKRFYAGVTMCEEWEDFEVFFRWADGKWREGLVIDRKNTLGGYSPENCRFVTSKINNQNSKRSKVWFIGGNVFGSAQDAANFLGCSQSHINFMCHGRSYNGKYYPPHDGCYTIKKYQEEQHVNA